MLNYTDLKTNINKSGQRLTPQRLTILKYLQSVTCHPTAEKIYHHVRQTIPNVSLGTVYRNLNYLAQKGLIIQFQKDANLTCFDGNPSDHLHFICQKCHKVYDIFENSPIDEKKLKQIGQPQKIECKIYGTCNKCLNK
ncbi:hypothetical protein A2533_01115 [Candidatus Falkowbacteria bacterium RIFOXYD2_FULL_35_9]|uniref:Transcriptional repressor n=1 Tax=Candidatus Falkowbacteria bacterium RIFOXYC2_FULL_36_12 TaxID=1798002 RepID=A0A1F5SWD5_9BACT|nr:MAG: hypothetical protein A2300_02165 [Candidatus Falkowbacteria bacterium RIFOXYB2_FULL_35_7]OGF31010.1 MAG: hypothetical protein A2478_01040 [Candidatus Falkowbacteria bacterium RIFOXYC2_FULL_36_12]OGF34438.1 MAG: hypothetical protein A2223_02840 [Candidatus Falkowbacteria bacterium RIFOXYA2_FULL_35_8]OGF47852.1 MAG: hypothetical protein A2533_01115 [Candidatus Falkowbacteria bacterium RIFOXYD2_FULL_35_9]